MLCLILPHRLDVMRSRIVSVSPRFSSSPTAPCPISGPHGVTGIDLVAKRMVRHASVAPPSLLLQPERPGLSPRHLSVRPRHHSSRTMPGRRMSSPRAASPRKVQAELGPLLAWTDTANLRVNTATLADGATLTPRIPGTSDSFCIATLPASAPDLASVASGETAQETAVLFCRSTGVALHPAFRSTTHTLCQFHDTFVDTATLLVALALSSRHPSISNLKCAPPRAPARRLPPPSQSSPQVLQRQHARGDSPTSQARPLRGADPSPVAGRGHRRGCVV